SVADDAPLKFAADIEPEPSRTELHLQQLHCPRASHLYGRAGYSAAVLVREPHVVPEPRSSFVPRAPRRLSDVRNRQAVLPPSLTANLGEMGRIALRFHSNIVSSTCSR